MIDFGLSEEERLLDDSARRFADEQLRPAERRHEAARSYPELVRTRHRALGFATILLPESAGGVGLPLAIAARVWERLAAADPAAPIGLGMVSIAALARSRRGAMLVRDRQPGAVIVEAIGAGERAQSSARRRRRGTSVVETARPASRPPPITGALAGESTTHGSPSASMTGTLAGESTTQGSRSAMASELAWVPCARPAWIAIISPTGVELATDFSVRDLERPALGLRAAGAAAVQLSPAACEPIGDAADAARWLVEVRVLAAASMLGAARDAADYARSYAKQRVAFGKPIAHHQGLAFALVEAATELDAAGLLLGAAAASEAPDQVAAAHALVARTALRVVERSLQALGGHGYLYDHPVEKRMRDVRALASLYGGVTTSERDAAERVLTGPDPVELR